MPEFNKPKLNEHSRVIIFAHGERSFVGINKNGPHKLQLKSSSVDHYTHDLLIDLTKASRGRAFNVELISCFGGAAISDIKFLPQGSSLITFSSGTRKLELKVKFSDYINFRCDNQFLSFANYICYHTDTTRFAINTTAGTRYFMNEIVTLTDRSLEGVIKWKEERLTKYVTFLEQIKSDVSEENKKRITQCIEVINSKELRKEFINLYDQQIYAQHLHSLLNEALDRKDKEKIKHLIKIGEDINAREYGNRTILHKLSFEDSSEMMIFLFEVIKDLNEEELRTDGSSHHKKEILIDAIDDYGETPLYISISRGCSNHVKILLENGSNPNIIGNRGYNAFHYAISTDSFIENSMLSLLVRKGAELNCCDNDGMTAIQLGIVLPFTEDRDRTIKSLIELGADVNLANNQGFSALYLATQHNRMEIVKTLLSNPKLDLMKIIQDPINPNDINRDKISKALAETVIELVKDANALAKNDQTWNIIKDRIITKLPEDMRLPVVIEASKALEGIPRTRLLGLLTESERDVVHTFIKPPSIQSTYRSIM